MDRVGKKLTVKCECHSNRIQELERANWLLENSLEEKDVMWDEEQEKEYIMQEPTLMDEGENEDGRMKKVYLPDEIQSK